MCVCVCQCIFVCMFVRACLCLGMCVFVWSEGCRAQANRRSRGCKLQTKHKINKQRRAALLLPRCCCCCCAVHIIDFYKLQELLSCCPHAETVIHKCLHIYTHINKYTYICMDFYLDSRAPKPDNFHAVCSWESLLTKIKSRTPTTTWAAKWESDN